MTKQALIQSIAENLAQQVECGLFELPYSSFDDDADISWYMQPDVADARKFYLRLAKETIAMIESSKKVKTNVRSKRKRSS